MKKSVIWILIIVMCVSICSCNKNDLTIMNNSSENTEESRNMNNNFTLLVNGSDIQISESVSINYEKQYAELPLIAISEALGGKVEWVNEKKVNIIFNDTRYVLNPTKKTLKKVGDSLNFNIIDLPPGTGHGRYCKVCDKEFIIDSDCLWHFMYLLGEKIEIDYNTSVVSISKK